MWHLAAESLGRFPEPIVTALSRDGYPISIRQHSVTYSAKSGEMLVSVPEAVDMMPGPANLLAHSHDDELSNLQMVHIKGRLEKRARDWVFVSTAFTPPPEGRFQSLSQMAKAMRRSSLRYLSTRGLDRPQVNWAALSKLQREARHNRRVAS